MEGREVTEKIMTSKNTKFNYSGLDYHKGKWDSYTGLPLLRRTTKAENQTFFLKISTTKVAPSSVSWALPLLLK